MNGEIQTHDLLSLTGGVTTLLGETTLEAGAYGQIRLIIIDAAVVSNGIQHMMTVPSGSESGLKIGNGFVVEEGGNIDLVLDFDAARSVVSAGASGQLLLKPRIRLVEIDDSGEIEGKLVVPADSSAEGWTVHALTGVDTVSSGFVKFEENDGQLEGSFKLCYLPLGSYDVVVVDGSGAEVYTFGSLTVSSNGSVNLGIRYLLGAVLSWTNSAIGKMKAETAVLNPLSVESSSLWTQVTC